MAIWAALIMTAPSIIGAGIDLFSDDPAEEAYKDQKEIGLKRLGLTEEEMKLQEKHRGFQRLMSLVDAGDKMTTKAAGAQRLTKLRNSGTGL